MNREPAVTLINVLHIKWLAIVSQPSNWGNACVFECLYMDSYMIVIVADRCEDSARSFISMLLAVTCTNF